MSNFETVRRPRAKTSAEAQARPGLLRFAPLGEAAEMTFTGLDAPMLSIGRSEDANLHVEDEEMSRKHAFVASLGGQVEIVDADSANGVFVNGVQVSRRRLEGGEVIRLGGTFFRFLRSGPPSGPLEPSGPPMLGGPTLAPAITLLERAARSDLPVLVLGETGTGKELAARRVHEAGPRATGPFVPVNCAAIPDHLLESELFGHRRGAFTGADAARRGLFREAEGGTLFLDEIGDLAAEAQAKLLRALETLKIRPVGDDGEVSVDVRVVAATHRDLAAEVEAGRFRRDLHARLARLVVRLPPLRDRVEDVPLIAQYLLQRQPPAPRLSADAIERLCAARWPDNVRGLAAALERARFVDPEAEVLQPEHFEDLEPPEPEAPGPEAPEPPSAPDPEASALAQALEQHRGDVEAAAASLGISRSQLYRRAQKAGLRVSAFKARDPRGR